MENIQAEARSVRKTYGDFVAVAGISFDVRPGEIFALLGPNGAGKTSTLESLEGLRAPDGGTLQVAGVDPTREPRKLRNLIGVQLQLALYLFSWDSRNTARRGHSLLALLALVPYAAGIFLLA